MGHLLFLNSHRHTHRLVGPLRTGMLPLPFLSSLVCVPRQATAVPCVLSDATAWASGVILPVDGSTFPGDKGGDRYRPWTGACSSWWKEEWDPSLFCDHSMSMIRPFPLKC